MLLDPAVQQWTLYHQDCLQKAVISQLADRLGSRSTYGTAIISRDFSSLMSRVSDIHLPGALNSTGGSVCGYVTGNLGVMDWGNCVCNPEPKMYGLVSQAGDIWGDAIGYREVSLQNANS